MDPSAPIFATNTKGNIIGDIYIYDVIETKYRFINIIEI